MKIISYELYRSVQECFSEAIKFKTSQAITEKIQCSILWCFMVNSPIRIRSIVNSSIQNFII